jgi:hypothetical protein
VDGSGGIASSLAGASLYEQALIEIIAIGGGVMPGFESSLTSDQIDEIALFVVGLGGGTAAGELTTSPGGGAPATAEPSDGSSADVAGQGANENVGTGPSYWGPLLVTLAAFTVVIGWLLFNLQRSDSNVSSDEQLEAPE